MESRAIGKRRQRRYSELDVPVCGLKWKWRAAFDAARAFNKLERDGTWSIIEGSGFVSRLYISRRFAPECYSRRVGRRLSYLERATSSRNILKTDGQPLPGQNPGLLTIPHRCLLKSGPEDTQARKTGTWFYLGFRTANVTMALTRRLTCDVQPQLWGDNCS